MQICESKETQKGMSIKAEMSGEPALKGSNVELKKHANYISVKACATAM